MHLPSVVEGASGYALGLDAAWQALKMNASSTRSVAIVTCRSTFKWSRSPDLVIGTLAFSRPGDHLPAAIAPDVLEGNDRSYDERLAACRMVESAESPVPTVLGCIVLSPRARDLIPSDFVQFLRIDGTTLSDPIKDEVTIDGPLAQILQRIDDKLEAHIQTSVDIVSNNIERRSPDYPLAAVQQLIRNAVMHRTYEATLLQCGSLGSVIASRFRVLQRPVWYRHA